MTMMAPAPAASGIAGSAARLDSAALLGSAGRAAGLLSFLRLAVSAGSGPTSSPTARTLPSMAKPQFSSCSPAVISCCDVQCSTVTISVTPCRLAMPM